MKREIKFRIYQNLNAPHEEPDWEVKEYEDIRYEPLCVLEGGLYYHIVQYTGLKDRNGVEIYEGDIIKETFPEGSIVSEVIFRNGAFGFKDGKTGFSSFDGTMGLITPQTSIDGEVIGNIYENPELLEAER